MKDSGNRSYIIERVKSPGVFPLKRFSLIKIFIHGSFSMSLPFTIMDFKRVEF